MDMDMDMSGMDMGSMSTSTTMSSTASSTGSTTSMAGMDMSSSSSMSGMMTSFFASTTTPLYTEGFHPTTVAGYTGICIFLIMLGVVFRFLIAVKAWKETAWLDAEYQRRYVHVAGKGDLAKRMSEDSDTKGMTLSENGLEEQVMVVKKHGITRRPWRITTDPIRAVIDTVIAGVGYLL